MNSNLIYLTQTDTTVGFLSSDDKKLSAIKGRPASQKILQVVDCCKTLQKHTRVPNRFKNKVRRSKKTTFIYPSGYAFRVVDKTSKHHSFIKKFTLLYSTSANKTKYDYDEKFAFENSDIILYNEKFIEKASSSIFKLNNKKVKRLR